ncbi:MAG: fluoride efflux transporter CrcB [Woeseiaceae bacterium]|jgi:CrcB protein|nr:fluoride efflux transporter CrcB [Woeseiaceae bacterium]
MRIVFYSYLFVAVGGALGAMARFGFNLFLQRDVEFPWGTLTSNLLGCLLMGVVAQLISNTAWFNDAGVIPDQYRLLFAVGFCGSFTTLSSLVLEMNAMLQKNEIFYSFTYFVGTLVGGFACFYIGIMCVRMFLRLQSS